MKVLQVALSQYAGLTERQSFHLAPLQAGRRPAIHFHYKGSLSLEVRSQPAAAQHDRSRLRQFEADGLKAFDDDDGDTDVDDEDDDDDDGHDDGNGDDDDDDDHHHHHDPHHHHHHHHHHAHHDGGWSGGSPCIGNNHDKKAVTIKASEETMTHACEDLRIAPPHLFQGVHPWFARFKMY